MPITRTARGTASDKSAGLTLTVSSVLIVPEARIVVGIGYDSGSGAPEITWGSNVLEDEITNTSGGVVSKISSFYKKGGVNQTLDVTATWTTTGPTAKAMWVEQLTDANAIEAGTASGAGGTSTSPASGAKTTKFYDEIHIGNIVTEGPATDTVGTVSNGWTSGQRVGTAGAPPISNVTSHEIFLLSELPGSAEAAKTGITSRDWSATMITYRLGGHPEGVDIGTMQETWDDLVNLVAIVESYGNTVHIEDSTDPTVDISNWADLELHKKPT